MTTGSYVLANHYLGNPFVGLVPPLTVGVVEEIAEDGGLTVGFHGIFLDNLDPVEDVRPA